MEKCLKKLIIESKKNKKEVPVSCLIIQNDKIIAIGHNTRESKNKVIAHAEVNAILKASKKLKTWKLDDCTLYVTLKPCNMCMEVIKQSRIKTVYYLVDKLNYKKEFDKTNLIKINDSELSGEYLKILSAFFSDKR